MISSLLMTRTVAPCAALPDAQGPRSFPLSSSYHQPPLLSPPSVQSNDCPLHAPYHSFLLSCCCLPWILKHGVETQCWQSYHMKAGSVCCKAAPWLTSHPTRLGIVVNIYTKHWEVQFSEGEIWKSTHFFSGLSGEPTNQLSAQVPSHNRGQGSDEEGQLAPDQAALRGLFCKWHQTPYVGCELSPHWAPAFISFLT